MMATFREYLMWKQKQNQPQPVQNTPQLPN